MAIKLNFSQIINVIHVIVWAITLYLIFIWSPVDTSIGITQKIFYFHVPIAWLGMLAVIGVGISSLLFLITKNYYWDDLAFSFAQTGIIFASLIIVTGALWAKPVWGVWWTWDPRLTTSLILWLIYVAYLMLRAYSPRGDQGARYAAVLGIAGFLDVPLVYLSIVLWRTVHPQALVGPAATGELDPSMRLLLMISTLTFTLLFAYLLADRFSLRRSEEGVETVRGFIEPPA